MSDRSLEQLSTSTTSSFRTYISLVDDDVTRQGGEAVHVVPAHERVAVDSCLLRDIHRDARIRDGDRHRHGSRGVVEEKHEGYVAKQHGGKIMSTMASKAGVSFPKGLERDLSLRMGYYIGSKSDSD